MNYIKLRGYIDTARVWSNMSTCSRLKVGAVIFNMNTKRIVSVGYNGSLSGLVHCSELFDFKNMKYRQSTDAEWRDATDEKMREMHHQFSEMYEVHAEQNAIYNMLKSQTIYSNTNDLGIISTTLPCIQCAKALAAVGIKYVFYENEYDRNSASSFEILNRAGIICRNIEKE